VNRSWIYSVAGPLLRLLLPTAAFDTPSGFRIGYGFVPNLTRPVGLSVLPLERDARHFAGCRYYEEGLRLAKQCIAFSKR